MTTLGWEQVRAWRAHRHGLGTRAPASELLAVASRLCGVHAQLMGSAELTLWARLEALDRAAVATALWEDRTLVKTWAMRGTLHLAVHGPGAREDFQRWWSRAVSPAAAGRILRSVEGVEEVEVDGEPLWMLAADAREAAAMRPAEGVRLLPAFDQYVVAATKHARRFLPGEFADRIYRPQGWLSPVLLVDGVMAGTWRHERRGRRLSVVVEPFGRLPKAHRAGVEAEAERLAAFLGGEVALAYA